MGAQNKDAEGRLDVAMVYYVVSSLSGSNWRKSHSPVRYLSSVEAESCQSKVAVSMSPLMTLCAGFETCACGVGQLDHGGLYGTLDWGTVHHQEGRVDFFPPSSPKGCWVLPTSMVSQKVFPMCSGCEKGDAADLWMLVWQEVRRFHQEGILLKVEHVKGITLFEPVVTDGIARADVVEDGGMLDAGEMAQFSSWLSLFGGGVSGMMVKSSSRSRNRKCVSF